MIINKNKKNTHSLQQQKKTAVRKFEMMFKGIKRHVES